MNYPPDFMEWVTWWDNTSSNSLISLLHTQKDEFSDIREKIIHLETEIKKVQSIIIEYTWQWTTYQEIYTDKKNQINELEKEYKQLQWENMTTEEQEEYIQQQKEDEEMRKEIFWSMGFDQNWARWTFETEEKYFYYQQKENKKRKDANHTKQNISDISWSLVDQLEDMSIKDLWRKIAFLLHPDRLHNNTDIKGDKDYIIYCEELFKTLQSLYEKEDMWLMIITLQDAGIEYKDWKLILPSKEKRWTIQKESQLHKQREELQERISTMKQSYIYIFYLKLKKWDIDKELRDLDNKIEELKDLIASYQIINHE